MKNFGKAKWKNTSKIESTPFICWNCGKNIATDEGYIALYKDKYGGINEKPMIYICHQCSAPSIVDNERHMILCPLPGKEIKKLPEEINCVYNEARTCMSVGAYTAAVMLFRKIIMNMAVAEGAKEGDKFINYVNYLCDNGFVHKRQTKQADEIRTMGNEANHKIECRTKEEAESMLKFIEFLLLNNYEFADEDATGE